MANRVTDDPLVAGHAALAGGDWAKAQERFEAVLATSPTPEGWEGLGWAGWWLGDEELTFTARDRAFRLFREAGDRAGAARLATWIAADFREFRGDVAIGRGWLERTHRLLDGLPDSAERGWLMLTEADFALNVDRDLAATRELAATATELARRLRLADQEAVGLALDGLASVGLGELEQGMKRLDEAAAIAVGEDLQLPLSSGWAICCLVSACDGVGDFDRAAQWCEALREFVEHWGGRQLLGVCRTSYGRILATRGDWAEAEGELTAALADFETARPAMAAAGLVRLGELRTRQGRAEDARRLFERAGPQGLVGLGNVALDGGDSLSGSELAQRALRRLPAPALLDRLPALELLARSLAAHGDLEGADRALDELQHAARAYPTAYIRGRAALAAGDVAAARGDGDAARRAYEDSIDAFEEGSAPYESALARLGLAAVLLVLDRPDHAATQAGRAREIFDRLGAERDRRRADELLAKLRAPGVDGFDELTRREVEVLQLVARGLSDAEIAEELVLSPHTVHRHVANVRTKLALPSRAAAVAYAARAGLL